MKRRIARIALQAFRFVLLALLCIQLLQLMSALRMLAGGGAGAFSVSPLLLAALIFKASLLLANAVLLWLAHRALRRPCPLPPPPIVRRMPFTGEQP